MDFLTPIVVCIIILVMCSLCGYCCKRRNNQALFHTPIVVTTTQTNPGGYPVSVQATPGGGLQATPFPTQMPMPQPAHAGYNPPYPTHPGVQQMPQPMSQVPQPMPYGSGPTGFQPHVAGYPPTVPTSDINPPSYEQVVGAEAYSKQAPFNPHYSN